MQRVKEFWLKNKRQLLTNFLVLAFAAIFLTWFLEYRYFINNASDTWVFVFERPLVFWYNSFLVWLILLFLTALTRRPLISFSVLWSLIIILTYIHINKFSARGFPLLPEDFMLAGEATSLAKFIDVWGMVALVLGVILTWVLGAILQKWFGKYLKLERATKSEQSFIKKHALISRGILLALSVMVFLGATDFVRNHKGQRYEDITWLNSQLVAWNQVRNYNYNGFVLGFLYNWQKFKLTEPADYSEERVGEIRDTYEKLAKQKNKNRLDLSEEAIDVVVILNESFFDPAVEFQGESFENYYPHEGGEILPTLRYVQANYPSGYMYSTDYGGGTANIEFEVLTGMTNYFTNTVPYTDLIPRAGSVDSLASYLNTQGYASTAIHPFNGSMYKRNIVLEKFGFSNFITELEMDYTDKEGSAEYINDRSAYRQTLDVLGQEGKQFVTLITMQNHLPYNHDIYEETDFSVTSDNLDDGKKQEIAVYYQMLHNSDKYLGEFIQALDASDKKTAVLFFGDHSAGIFELTNGHEDKKVRDLSRLTPYFVYTNFETEKQELPMTTPNCLSNTLLDVIGAQKPKINYLLDAICAEAPILTNTWLDEAGAVDSEALKNYEMIIYDVLGGKKYWQN